MAVFRFSLERVLELRTQKVDECERAQRAAQAAVETLEGMLYEARDAYFADRDGLNEKRRDARLDEATLFEVSLELRKRRMLELLEALRTARADAEQAARDLVEARRELRALEILKERRTAEFLKREEERERKFLDEQASLRLSALRRAEAAAEDEEGGSFT